MLTVSILINYVINRIDTNYSDYITYLLKSIKNVNNTIDTPQGIELLFNSKDYDYFIENLDKITSLFKNPVEINKEKRDFISS